MDSKSIPKSMNYHEQKGADKSMRGRGSGGPKDSGRRGGFFGGPNTLRHVIRGATRRQATRRKSRRGAMARRHKRRRRRCYSLVTPRRAELGGGYELTFERKRPTRVISENPQITKFPTFPTISNKYIYTIYTYYKIKV